MAWPRMAFSYIIFLLLDVICNAKTWVNEHPNSNWLSALALLFMLGMSRSCHQVLLSRLREPKAAQTCWVSIYLLTSIHEAFR